LPIPASGGACGPPRNGTAWRCPWRGALRYRLEPGDELGVTALTLKTGKAASITLRGAGAKLGLATLRAAPPVRVQLQNADGRCWEAAYTPDEVRTGDGHTLHARE
jgi:hypothetical protein